MITLGLSIPETNLVLQSLGNLPYVQVYQLIEKISTQAKASVESVGETKDVD